MCMLYATEITIMVMVVCREQEGLKERLEVGDGEEVASWVEDTLPFAHLNTIAGVDISFDKTHPDHACAMLAILSYPQLKVKHSSTHSTVLAGRAEKGGCGIFLWETNNFLGMPAHNIGNPAVLILDVYTTHKCM